MPNYNRKLATIQKITSFEPIPNADRIEIANVLGWKVVVKKNEYNTSDYIVYFEVDSFLPIRPEFEFLRQNSYKKNELVGEGFLLKTQQFRGQISQGLIMKITDIPALQNVTDLYCGKDVTNIIGVKLYERPVGTSYQGNVIGAFHSTVSKTDEIRIQSAPHYLDLLKGKPYYITEKIDGTSTTIVRENGVTSIYTASGKIDTSTEEACNNSAFVTLLKEKGIWDILENLDNSINIAFQGEYYGEGIQGNRVGIVGRDFAVFNIIDPITNKRYSYPEWEGILTKLGLYGILHTVRILKFGSAFNMSIDELLTLADGNYKYTNKPREGIVVRPMYEETIDGTMDRLSFKVINNKYLLKHKE